MSTYQMKLGGHTLESAPAEARPLLEAAQRQIGMIPNMYARMAQLPGVLSTYQHGYELFRATAGLTPVEQEVVLLTISRENGCEYCVAAHSMVGKVMSKVPPEVLEAVRAGAPIADARLHALAAFTQVMVAKRGNPTDADVAPFLAAGYTEHQILGVILAIAVKTLSNYSNHIFHTPVDGAFASFAWTKPAADCGATKETACHS
jgi:uncharacterized peroxidase-related enzyme